MSWGKVGAKKRSDSLRTDKLQGEKRGREQGREGGGGGKRERERGGKLSEERSLSLSLFLSVCPTCRLLLLLSPVFLGFLAASDWLEEFQLVFRLPFGFEHGLRLNSYAH